MNESNIDDIIEIAEFMKRFLIVNITARICDRTFVFSMSDHNGSCHLTFEIEDGDGHSLPLDSLYHWKELYPRQQT